MNNLSTLYMNLLKSRVDVQSILGQMNRLIKSDNPKKAMALEPKLKHALANEQRALTAYMTALRADALPGKVMELSSFRALSPQRKLDFIKSGGQVQN